MRAYALCLLGSPAASLADLERAAALSGEKHQAPGWVVAAEAHARGDRVSLARLADDGARPARLLARLLVLREAELGGRQVARGHAADPMLAVVHKNRAGPSAVQR